MKKEVEGAYSLLANIIPLLNLITTRKSRSYTLLFPLFSHFLYTIKLNLFFHVAKNCNYGFTSFEMKSLVTRGFI